MRRILDVARNQYRPAPGLFDPASRLLRILMLAEIRNQDVGALAGKGDSDCSPDPGISSGDQRDALFQFAAAAVRMLTVIWLGVELFGKAGRVLLLAGLRRGRTGCLRICRLGFESCRRWELNQYIR